MKFTLVVRQAAVVEAGLIGKVNANDLCLLHYLRGWFSCDGAETKLVDGRKYVWLRSETAIEELPLLFNPNAKTASRRNQLSAMIERLRAIELVVTIQKRRLFFRLTETALRVTQRNHQDNQKAKATTHIVTPQHDETITPERDKTFTSSRDEYLPTNIDETGTTESESTETPPSSPSEGDAKSILTFWNSFPDLPPLRAITANRARKICRRLADPFWREHWRDGIKRLAASDFAKGSGLTGWRANFDWFLGGDSLARILEGAYDNRPQHPPKLLPSDLRAQLKAVDELIAEHPANVESGSHDPDVTPQQYEDLRKLRRRRKELVRQLAGVSK